MVCKCVCCVRCKNTWCIYLSIYLINHVDHICVRCSNTYDLLGAERRESKLAWSCRSISANEILPSNLISGNCPKISRRSHCPTPVLQRCVLQQLSYNVRRRKRRIAAYIRRLCLCAWCVWYVNKYRYLVYMNCLHKYKYCLHMPCTHHSVWVHTYT